MAFANGRVIDQGFTDAQGCIVVYGAAEGDVLRAQSPDGGRWGELTVGQALTYTLLLRPVGQLRAAAEAINPHVSLLPGSDGSTLYLTLRGVAPGGALYALVVPPGSATPLRTPLAYSANTGAYSSTVSFPTPVVGSGSLHVRGLGPQGEMVAVDSEFSLLSMEGSAGEDLYTTDGNMWVHLDEGCAVCSRSPSAFALDQPGQCPTEAWPPEHLRAILLDLETRGQSRSSNGCPTSLPCACGLMLRLRAC
ncbi:MAG TPA: hypothetical protein EYP04_12840 [Anaerolineae bacterium]|nr:hypothetical protein [Anaerolineae bacterium]HIQ05192.1 hypothetical protein [Anaerolineae bacterium]